MSLQTKLQDVLTRIGTEFKAVRAVTGQLSALSTTNKTNLVAALNELKNLIDTAAVLNDAATGSTTSTLSANKISQLIATAKSEILGGASSAFDTLLEIQNALAADDADINGLLTAVNNRVRYDAAQALSAGQKAQALTNIGGVSTDDIGDVNTNFVTVFESALV